MLYLLTFALVIVAASSFFILFVLLSSVVAPVDKNRTMTDEALATHHEYNETVDRR